MSEPRAFYNEIDPFAAAWLRELIKAGQIAPGDVDERSIVDVRPDDLRGYTQCHFFAGIGVWSYALRRAGWPDSRPIWTMSCPCQPFSAAGKGAGFADERHLWPYAHYLVQECGPPVVAGEQVASKAVDDWIDLVQTDMEAVGYAFGAIPFPSAGVGAPHIRDRTYWLGKRLDDAPGARRVGSLGDTESLARDETWLRLLGAGSEADKLADPQQQGLEGLGQGSAAESGRNGALRPVAEAGQSGRLANADGWNTSAERQQRGGEQRQQPQDSGLSGLADAESAGRREQRTDTVRSGERSSTTGLEQRPRSGGVLAGDGWTGPTNGHWRDADWLFCRDGKWRPVEPGTQPLAHGAPARVGRLRGYGNAINAEAAVAFIEAYLETEAADAECVRVEGAFA